MKLLPYSQYVQTGSIWIGELPSHWSTALLRHVCDKITDGSHFSPASVPDGKPYVTVRDLNAGHINLHTCAKISDADFESLVRSGCRPIKGDVLFSKDGTVGKVAVVEDGDFVVLSSLAILGTNRDKHRPEYLAYFLQSASGEKQIESMYAGAALRRITLDSICTIRLPVLPLEEQDCIASFLDRETAKIDTLIAKQEKLIELLEEKRQAVISHAVTKGLDPTAPMKPSGVEWLGEIPAHWGVKKLSWFFSGEKGKRAQLLTKEYCAENEGDYPVYSGQTENNGIMGTLNDFEYDFGDEGVIFSTTVGANAMHLKHLKGRFSLSQNCMIIKPKDLSLSVDFYFHHFQPLFFFERDQIPDHMQPSFRMDDLYKYWFALPPLEEQEMICEYLDAELGRIDLLIAKAEQAISLQQEHRIALISAAVTGKIDVRDAVPSLEQAA